MYEQIIKRLYELSEADYKQFNQNLLPGVEHILGIRVPILRDLAKEIVKNQDWQKYLLEAREATKQSGAVYEEKLLYGLVIGYAHMLNVERKAWLSRFIPVIDNWGVCDSSCMTYQFMKKDQKLWWEFLQPYLCSKQEFEIRFGVVAMLDHFVNDEYVERVLSACNRIHHDGYYVKMAVAWAVSVCFVKYLEQTYQFLMTDTLDDFTHNKAIQKCRESFRVTQDMKDELKKMKR